jgi:hypothetical protein
VRRAAAMVHWPWNPPWRSDETTLYSSTASLGSAAISLASFLTDLKMSILHSKKIDHIQDFQNAEKKQQWANLIWKAAILILVQSISKASACIKLVFGKQPVLTGSQLNSPNSMGGDFLTF